MRGARHIEKNGDKCRAGLPRITAWSGAVAASLLIQGAPTRIDRAEAGLERAIRSGLSEDGGLISRSPVEQLVLVETLPLLRSAYATGTRGIPDWLDEAQEGALACLLSLLAADGAMTSWQGGNPSDAKRIAAAIAAAALGDRPVPQARGWGYQRLQAKESVLVLDAAPPQLTISRCAPSPYSNAKVEAQAPASALAAGGGAASITSTDSFACSR